MVTPPTVVLDQFQVKSIQERNDPACQLRSHDQVDNTNSGQLSQNITSIGYTKERVLAGVLTAQLVGQEDFGNFYRTMPPTAGWTVAKSVTAILADPPNRTRISKVASFLVDSGKVVPGLATDDDGRWRSGWWPLPSIGDRDQIASLLDSRAGVVDDHAGARG